MLDPGVRAKLEAVRAALGSPERLLIAFSGGVDSGLLLALATEVLGTERVLAVTVVSELLPQRDLEQVQRFLVHQGIRHRLVQFPWQRYPALLQNRRDRCAVCKRELVQLLKAIAAEEGIETVAEGVTVSDLAEYRPGLAVATAAGIWHPLLDAGITKPEARLIAKELGLPFWSKPSSPCLATRIAYDEPITSENLHMIDSAEDLLKERGFTQFRVRLHPGGLARIEVAAEELDALCDRSVLREVAQQVKALGFSYVTLDLEGYRSGSMDRGLSK
jgi:uncharacterized protein